MTKLNDRVAIVTGAASGIGLAIARRFAADGAKIVMCDIQDGEDAAREIRDEGGEAVFLSCNVADESAVDALVAAAVTQFGQIDIVVNAAAMLQAADFLKLTSKQFADEIEVNLKGPFYLAQRVARHLVRRNAPGSIINITSTAAEHGSAAQVSYCTTKSGLAGMTRGMAVALAPYNIRVNALAPGPTATPGGVRGLNDPAVRELMLSRTPLGRYADPAEQAAAAAFLASDDASFITGHTLFVDGGRMILGHTMDTNLAPREAE